MRDDSGSVFKEGDKAKFVRKGLFRHLHLTTYSYKRVCHDLFNDPQWKAIAIGSLDDGIYYTNLRDVAGRSSNGNITLLVPDESRWNPQVAFCYNKVLRSCSAVEP